MMKDLLKEQYSLPTCRVIEVRVAGIIATSSDPQWNDPFGEEEGV